MMFLRLNGASAILALLTATALRSESGLVTYQALTRFQLSGATVRAENLILQRDRVKMTFNGVFYLETPVAGYARGAIFLGKGTFASDASPIEFERDNVRRLLKAESVESDFQNAVLRFSDETHTELVAATTQLPSSIEAQRLADRFAPQLLRETGANIPARVASSILNGEKPGFFCATFDKGRRGRFTYMLDLQGRLLSSAFMVNAGESGIVFAHRDESSGNDIWMAFHTLDDYALGRSRYSDIYNQVVVRHYDMDIDLRAAAKKKLAILARMQIESRCAGLRAASFLLNEGLGEANSERLKRALRVQHVHSGASELLFAQEDWESGFTVFLPNTLGAGEKLTLVVDAAGDAMLTRSDIEIREVDAYYPLVSTSWYPRHGYLARSTFELSFRSKPHDVVVGPGVRTAESNQDGDRVTHYSAETPITYVTFAAGDFRRTEQHSPQGVAIEYYATGNASGFTSERSSTFIADDLANAVQYFSQLFGSYPSKTLRGVYQPRPFGQGLPTLLLLAATPVWNDEVAHSFIAHETAHQWWGDMVAWRSYRDQWLSEGFAEYSGELYAAARMNADAGKDLIRRMRRTLQQPPIGDISVHKGRIADLGPIVLGHRLATRESLNGYQALIYAKGALVLRMLHFLLSDPQTGDDRPFFAMLTEFVARNQGNDATTEDFRNLASAYFARSPIGLQYKLADLNWFFRQWVYESNFPSYRMEYHIEDQPDHGVILRGSVTQANAGDKWFMPLPVVMQFGKDKVARGTIYAYGEKTDFTLKLPARPSSVQLDPELWILSDSTTTLASR